MNRTFDLLWLAIRQFFKHPVENIRQANPIKPGRLYENYGYICKAVPYTPREQILVNNYLNTDEKAGIALDSDILLEQVKALGIRNTDEIKRLQQEAAMASNTPVCCQLCDFAREGIPCPIYNQLKDGTSVCDTHKYIILKTPKK